MPDDGDLPGGRRGYGRCVGKKATVHQHERTIGKRERCDDVLAHLATLRQIDHRHLPARGVGAGEGDIAPLDITRLHIGGDHVGEGRYGLRRIGGDRGVEGALALQPVQLPKAEVHHEHHEPDDEDVEGDPLRLGEEAVHQVRSHSMPSGDAGSSKRCAGVRRSIWPMSPR